MALLAHANRRDIKKNRGRYFLTRKRKTNVKLQVYSLISSISTYFYMFTPWSLDSFVCHLNTILQPFRRIKFIIHISVLPGTHFHLSQVKNLSGFAKDTTSKQCPKTLYFSEILHQAGFATARQVATMPTLRALTTAPCPSIFLTISSEAVLLLADCDLVSPNQVFTASTTSRKYVKRSKSTRGNYCWGMETSVTQASIYRWGIETSLWPTRFYNPRLDATVWDWLHSTICGFIYWWLCSVGWDHQFHEICDGNPIQMINSPI